MKTRIVSELRTMAINKDKPDSRDNNGFCWGDDNDSMEDCHTFQLWIRHHELPNKLLVSISL